METMETPLDPPLRREGVEEEEGAKGKSKRREGENGEDRPFT
jgi:hypothetical protein